jgi:hypothetical protein
VGKIELLPQMYKSIVIVIGLLMCLSSAAQTGATGVADSSSKKNEWKFLFGFDTRTSWVLGEKAGLAGLKIGTTLNKKHRFGIGIYFLKSPIIRDGVDLPVADYPTASDTTRYTFGYSSFFYEPVWYTSKRLSLSTPFHLGRSTVTAAYKFQDSTGTGFTDYFTGDVGLYEISGVANFKIFRWFAIGAGAGYRGILTPDANARRAFGGLVLIFQAKVMFGVIYKLAFKKPIDDGWEQAED